MRYYNTLNDGEIARRITQKLRNLTAAEIFELHDAGYLTLKRSDYKISYESLVRTGLEAYAKACHTSVRYFLYGTEEKVIPTFTPYDGAVIRFVDSLSDSQQQAFYNLIIELYHNPYYGPFNIIPSQWIVEHLQRLPFGAISSAKFDPFGCKQYHKDISLELQRLAKGRYSIYFNFATDYWPDLSTFAGVSLHHIFQLKTPLFCDTQTGDLIFDFFCLLQPEQQIELAQVISELQRGASTV